MSISTFKSQVIECHQTWSTDIYIYIYIFYIYIYVYTYIHTHTYIYILYIHIYIHIQGLSGIFREMWKCGNQELSSRYFSF